MKVATLVLLLAVFACSTPTPDAGGRDPDKANALTREAEALLESNPQEAEPVLKRALIADLHHGPAHNNLGVLYLKASKLYEAATEFESARKLLPTSADPRFNLGVAFERAGRIEPALESYRSALEVEPDHIATMQALAQLLTRTHTPDAKLDQYLEHIAQEGDSETWRAWARHQQLKQESESR